RACRALAARFRSCPAAGRTAAAAAWPAAGLPAAAVAAAPGAAAAPARCRNSCNPAGPAAAAAVARARRPAAPKRWRGGYACFPSTRWDEIPAPALRSPSMTPLLALLLAQATFHGNNARTGVYAGAGPSQPAVKWTFKAGGPIVTSPAVADGVVY